ncbi:MAG: hypothetical protein CFH01_01648 [Alphaproteobacteria bacterium MarineAlpha2_Bin1]|nr:MAG: hypothetical protein CFH01_01648 [Alphaproteobacteria bacterium MarineAlpha2_Bin1]
MMKTYNSIRKNINLSDLPPSNTKRWVIKRKAIVVDAVKSGVLSLDEACTKYSLSLEEFFSWQEAMEKHGSRGLRATRIQYYRNPRENRAN